MNESKYLTLRNEIFAPSLFYNLLFNIFSFLYQLNITYICVVKLKCMKKIFFIGFVVLGITACNDASTNVESNQEQVSNPEEEITEVVVANAVMTMDVDGMVCKMGCGGGIRKELKATGAVGSVEFDFEEERLTNVATIYFDQTKISAEEMIKVVSEMNDKQFTVGETSTEDYTEAKSDEEETGSTSNSENVIETYSRSVELPNLLDLLSGLFI